MLTAERLSTKPPLGPRSEIKKLFRVKIPKTFAIWFLEKPVAWLSCIAFRFSDELAINAIACIAIDDASDMLKTLLTIHVFRYLNTQM